jgi:ribonuclease P protein component
MREEDVPAEQPKAEEEARLPAPHAHPRRPGGPQEPAGQGPLAAVGLIWRVRDRASFRALATGRRIRRGPVVITVAPAPTPGPPRVAYAVGRTVGPAVVRNRVRRRLRAAVRAHADALAPDTLYLVGARPAAATTAFTELSDALSAGLRTERGR